MLKKKIDFFREIILMAILFHFVLSLYVFSGCVLSDLVGIGRVIICGSLILSLIMGYLLQFFLWTPIRYEQYTEGRETLFLLWTILLAIWSFSFVYLMNNGFNRIIISGGILLVIYMLTRYRIRICLTEESLQKQLKEDAVSLLFLSISQLFLSGILILETNLREENVFLLIAGAFVISEMLICYLNYKLRGKVFSTLNALLIGVICLVFMIKGIGIEPKSNLLYMGHVCGFFLGWCFCISQIKIYQNKVT